MEEKQNIINVKEIIGIIQKNKFLYAKVLIVAFVLALAWILPQPRTYNSKVVLAPETEDLPSGGSLSSLASSFGFNMGSLASTDAIYPTLYPELLESPNFMHSLFDVQIETEDGSLKCDYYTYLEKHQKFSFWLYPKVWFNNFLNSLAKEDAGGKVTKPKGVFNLSKKELEIIEGMVGKIKCTVDKKTDVTTITVEDQDRKVCALIADSVRVKLQQHITDYRTRKARKDLDYYTELTSKAKANYEKARQLYASYADANVEVSLKSFQSKIDDLENDMQLKYNTYTAMTTRLEAARAKVQERTPAFTVLHEASMPRKPTGPKRMIFIAGMMFLSFVGLTAFLYIRKNKEQKK